MKIDVKYLPRVDEVNTRIFEDSVLIQCNHANRYKEIVDNGYADSTIGDWRDMWMSCWVCDKCGWVGEIE
jgi:rubrerythrin